MGFARLGAPLELVGHRTGAPALDAVAAYLIDGLPRWGEGAQLSPAELT